MGKKTPTYLVRSFKLYNQVARHPSLAQEYKTSLVFHRVNINSLLTKKQTNKDMK